MSRPVLLLAVGNPSRGDDALGPAFAAEAERRFGGQLDVVLDFQLMPEHVLELEGRDRVYFIDAAASGEEVQVTPVAPLADASFTTHALSPSALLYTASLMMPGPLPACRVIAIRGERFELGEPLSAAARRNLDVALERLAAELDAAPDRFRGAGHQPA